MGSPNRPQILFVSDTAEQTGPTNSLWLLLKHLHERFECQVLLPGRGAFSDSLGTLGIGVTSFASLRKWELWRMVRFIRSGNFDLVYGNVLSSGTRNAMIAGRLARRPYALHVRSMVRGDRRVPAWLLRHADVVIAVSRAAARSCEPFLSGVPAHVVYNGVDISEWVPDRRGARMHLLRELDLDENTLILVSLGNLDSRKAPEYSVRALERLTAVWPTIHLVLAGRIDREPAYAARLKETVRSLGLANRVSFLGFRPDVAQILGAADIFVHTALNDPHPRAVVEAMAMGIPVVAFAVDGVAETVLDGITGRLVATGDESELERAMSDLIAHPDRRADLGAAGRRRAEEHYSASRTAERVAAILTGALRFDPGRPSSEVLEN